jgi:hypothetical protein
VVRESDILTLVDYSKRRRTFIEITFEKLHDIVENAASVTPMGLLTSHIVQRLQQASWQRCNCGRSTFPKSIP